MNSIAPNWNETQQRIFTVAAKLFADRGFNGVSMREISEMSGVSKPTIYYYFGSKEGIFTTLVKAGFEFNNAYLNQILARDIPIKAKMTELLQFRFRQVLEFPDLARFFIILFSTGNQYPFLAQYILEAQNRRTIITDLIREGIQSNEFGPGVNPELATELFIAAMMHFMQLQLNSNQVILTEKLSYDIVELLFRGLNE